MGLGFGAEGEALADDFKYDVFLSHSSKDKAVVRAVAERLREDGLRVWLDDWELQPGDSIPAKIEEGLEHSRVLVLCMSANAFGSDWAQLEAGTFRFRDPLNKERRLRLPTLWHAERQSAGAYAEAARQEKRGHRGVRHLRETLRSLG